MEDGISRGVDPRVQWLPVIGLTCLGLALRVVGLRAKAYWTDEIATVDLVRGGIGHAMSELAHIENTPPLYYVLAWPWAHLFGTSEVGLRSLSTVVSVALIPIAYLIGRQLLGSRVGLIAAALVATNPMLVWYGQDARAYALLSLLTGVSFLLFLRALDSPTTGRLVAWGVCCGLAVATHYFAVFLVTAEVAVLLWKSRRRAHVVVAATAIPVVTALALIPLALTQERQRANWIGEMSLPGRVIKAPAVFIVGFESPAAHTVTALAALICAAGVWLLVFRTTSAVRRRGLLALGIGAASFALALLGAHYFLYRNVIGALVPILAGLACGFGAARAGRLGPALATALCLLSLGVLVANAHTPKFGKNDWRNAAAVVERGGGDKAVVVTPSGSRPPLTYYLGAQRAPFLGPGLRVAEIAVVAGADRPPGSDATARPPNRATPPAPAGFVLEQRDEHRYFTVITYQARSRRWVSREALEALALGPNARIIALGAKNG